MPIDGSREAGSVLWLIYWACSNDFNLLEKHKATWKVNWNGVFFIICCWNILRYGEWWDWNLFQSGFCELERSNKKCFRLQRQQKGWFLWNAYTVISVEIESSHSKYIKNIKLFKRSQALFWSHCWCIFSSLFYLFYFIFFPQPGKIDPLTSCCSSRQSSRTLRLRRPSRPVSDHLGIWHKVYLPRAPALGSKDCCNMLFTVRTGREKKAEYRSLVFWALVLYLRSQELLPKLLASWQILFSNIH